MKNRLYRLTAAAVLAGGTFLALAQEVPAQPAQPAPFQRRAARVAQYLGLTPDQQTQIQAQFQALGQSTQPVRQQLKQLRANMFQAIRTNDTATIQQLSAQEASLRGQLITARSETMAKVYGMLTPAQQAKADQLPAMFRQMRQRRMQHRQNANNG
ncbi:MAG TPA: Spy/CpxP family protein refolding chaperone [Bryobacteraceae bacterium]|nr:Spy/CpxP family protein refolding chaperone [Bryobacteraceae bacterium]